MEGPPPELILSARSESGFKGVHKAGASGWTAQLSFRGKVYAIGTFADPEEAALAYAFTARALKEEDARGRLRSSAATSRAPPRLSRAVPLTPLNAAVLAVAAELTAGQDGAEQQGPDSPCIFLHPLSKRWMCAGWCGSALGDFDSAEDAALAIIALIEAAGGDRTQPPSESLRALELLPVGGSTEIASSTEIATVISEVVTDLISATEKGLLSLDEVRAPFRTAPAKKPHYKPKARAGAAAAAGGGGAPAMEADQPSATASVTVAPSFVALIDDADKADGPAAASSLPPGEALPMLPPLPALPGAAVGHGGSTGAAEAAEDEAGSWLAIGNPIEVAQDEEGFEGSHYDGKVVAPSQDGKVLIEYVAFAESEEGDTQLTECVACPWPHSSLAVRLHARMPARMIRPPAPSTVHAGGSHGAGCGLGLRRRPPATGWLGRR